MCTYLISAVEHIVPKLNSIKYYQYHEVPKSDDVLEISINLRDKLEDTSSDPLEADIASGAYNDKLIYIYTSGTTGLPKAAVITNNR